MLGTTSAHIKKIHPEFNVSGKVHKCMFKIRVQSCLVQILSTSIKTQEGKPVPVLLPIRNDRKAVCVISLSAHVRVSP